MICEVLGGTTDTRADGKCVECVWMDGSAGGVEEDAVGTHSGVLGQTCKNRQIIAHGPGQRERSLQRTERTAIQSGNKITSHVYDQILILWSGWSCWS